MRTTTKPLVAVADQVTALFEGVFAEVDGMRLALLDHFAEGRPDAERVGAVVHPLASALLDQGLVLGCGYVAARDALVDRTLYLAWWQGETQQLLGQADAPAGDPLDYTRREWFRVPETTGLRHVTGPYVDYVCTDEYVVTSTIPVLSGGRMLGIVGADILVETLEDLLLDPLREAGATLISENGRVIASADHHLAAGTLLDEGAGSERVACGTLPLALLA
ncbi:MAG TPA: cache domain-containing protein [Nocardioidaceae bacterium]|nr:cache domain-containing protein [Nocardioidaceae bacterium]